VPEPAIEVEDLHKSYGSFEAVRGIDLHVDRGEVFALLGPNGAGKTTAVEILEGHRARSSGSVRVLGFDPAHGGVDYRRRIGIVLQDGGVDRFLTVAEVIEQFRGFYPDPLPLDDIIEVVGLADKRDDLVRRLSGGQQRRLDVAIGLAGNPELLFLDEPTTGFDPSARRQAWEMVKDLQSLGKTVFLTTHYMDEAEHLADRVAVIVEGRIVAEGSPAALRAATGISTGISFRLPTDAHLPPELAGVFDVNEQVAHGRTDTPARLLHDLTGWALSSGVDLYELHVAAPSLEDVYLALTGHAAGDDRATAEDATEDDGRRRRSGPRSRPRARSRGRS
jgi:ABC-2 type transport system ATP-binding protein